MWKGALLVCAMKKVVFILMQLGLCFSLFAQASLVKDTVLYVHDTPFFPYGIYTEGIYEEVEFLSIVDSLATTEINTLWLEANAADESVFRTFHTQCASNNIRSIIGLPSYVQFADDFEYWLNFHKPFSTVLGWGILDDSNNFSVEELIDQQNRALQLDSSRITYQSMYALGIVEAFSPFTPVTAMQGYPWGNGNDDLAATYSTYSGFCDTVKMLGNVPVVNNQIFNWEEETYPSAEHFDCQTYLALVCGARGIINYTYWDYDQRKPISNTQTSLWNQLKQNAREVGNERLQNFLLFGNYQRTRINFYSSYALWEYEGSRLLILVNGSSTAVESVRLELPELAGLEQNLLFEERDDLLSRLNDTTLVGKVPPYGVCVYTFDSLKAILPDSVTISVPVLANHDRVQSSSLFYPNPTEGVLHVRNPSRLSCVEIRSSMGKLVKRLVHVESFLDLSDLSTGVYIVTLFDRKGDITHVERLVRK